MRTWKLKWTLTALLVLCCGAFAVEGVARWPGKVKRTVDEGWTDGTFEMPYTTGPPPAPPTFLPPQRFVPANGGPPWTVSEEWGQRIGYVGPGATKYHFSITPLPHFPNITVLTMHTDYNGDGKFDPGEPCVSQMLAN